MSDSPSPTDSIKLFERFRADDSLAADELFERYVSRLTALVRVRMSPKLARRLDAEDVIQSAYRSFFTKAKEGRFELKQGGDLWRLLAAIALNKLNKQIERHLAAKRNPDAEQIGADDDQVGGAWAGASAEPSPASIALLEDEIELLTSDLDEVQSEMFSMRLAGCTVEEIAEATQRSERTVRRLLTKIREQMQSRLDSFASQ